MKKSRLLLLLGTALAALMFTGCPKTTDTSDGKDIKICLLGADSSKTWNIWAWNSSSNLTSSGYVAQGEAKWPGDLTLDQKDSTYGYVYRTINVNPDEDLSYLWVDTTASVQTGDRSIPSSYLTEYDTLYFIYSNDTVYTSVDSLLGLKNASITAEDGSTVTCSIFGAGSVSAGDFTVKASDGTALTVNAASISGSTATVVLSNGDISKAPYTVTYKNNSVTAAIDSSIVDSVAYYDGSDLGATFTDKSAVTFKTWAPTATKVVLLLFTDSSSLSSPAKTYDMTSSGEGVWTKEDVDCSSYDYYKFRVTTSASTYDVCDIWAKAASGDSVAAQIVNINKDANAMPESSYGTETFNGEQSSYYNPFGSVSGTTVDTEKNYTDAIIYEMHIRDWSRAVDSSSTGKFLTIADSETIINHLKDIGVTHVQILPMFDYAQKNADSAYNWGYNPYHYNVPEGRYVTSGYTDGTQAVKEMRTMIEALHNAGISVIMDVVYNHTSGTGSNSLYDMTVPEYFYRLNSDGSYSNGSGCGNEVATNHKMVKKYVIDSLKHWMLDYHINGFRFDLMGLHETSTMKEIYAALSAIDPNVMVYGEPWTGGSSLVSGGCSRSNINSASSSSSVNGVGCFDDAFRDAVKGASTGAVGKGYVNGDASSTSSAVEKALCGSITGSPKVEKIGRFLNYAECHDNYTLFDKLCDVYLQKAYTGDMLSAIGTDGLAEIKKQDILVAAFTILAQGTPFINGGQEFLRTKMGNPDSYASDTKGGKYWSETEINKCNTVDLGMKTKYSDVYNYYKGLIALRKAYPEVFGGNEDASADNYGADGVMRYITGDFIVWFNASSSEYSIGGDLQSAEHLTKVDVSSGAIVETTLSETLTSVPAMSFVVIKK